MAAQCPDHCKKLYKMVKIGVKLSGKPAKPSYSISDSGQTEVNEHLKGRQNPNPGNADMRPGPVKSE